VPLNLSAPSIRERDRSIIAEWDLGPTEFHGAPATYYASLHVGHSTERKAFYALLNNETSQGYARTSMPFDAVRLPGEPVARCSAKRLRAFFDATLAAVQADPDEYVAIFAAPGVELEAAA
jgi:hypothetical protein